MMKRLTREWIERQREGNEEGKAYSSPVHRLATRADGKDLVAALTDRALNIGSVKDHSGPERVCLKGIHGGNLPINSF